VSQRAHRERSFQALRDTRARAVEGVPYGAAENDGVSNRGERHAPADLFAIRGELDALNRDDQFGIPQNRALDVIELAERLGGAETARRSRCAQTIAGARNASLPVPKGQAG